MFYYFPIARNILFVVIVISHDYSLPLSKMFCLKGSLNLKERRGDFLVVFCESCTFKMVHFLKSESRSAKISRPVFAIKCHVFVLRHQL